jgi:hypothetical protein
MDKFQGKLGNVPYGGRVYSCYSICTKAWNKHELYCGGFQQNFTSFQPNEIENYEFLENCYKDLNKDYINNEAIW